jgi:hypothetical protein
MSALGENLSHQFEALRKQLGTLETPHGFTRFTLKIQGHTVSWALPSSVSEPEARQLRAMFETELRKRQK